MCNALHLPQEALPPPLQVPLVMALLLLLLLAHTPGPIPQPELQTGALWAAHLHHQPSTANSLARDPTLVMAWLDQ